MAGFDCHRCQPFSFLSSILFLSKCAFVCLFVWPVPQLVCLFVWPVPQLVCLFVCLACTTACLFVCLACTTACLYLSPICFLSKCLFVCLFVCLFGLYRCLCLLTRRYCERLEGQFLTWNIFNTTFCREDKVQTHSSRLADE